MTMLHVAPPAAGMAAVLDAVDAPVWEPDRDGSLTCVQTYDVTPDIRCFVLASPGRRFRFDPGQYVTVSLPQLPGVSRCYTITTPPTRPHTIAITVKRQEGGMFSPILHDTLGVGGQLVVDGPFGNFSAVHHPASRYLFVSGGSGVTPLMSMLRTLHDAPAGADVAFVHFARTPADVPFAAELAAIAAAEPSVRLTVVVDDAPAGTQAAWHGLRGRVSAELLGTAVSDAADREAFVCGPRPFMTATRESLARLGLPEARYHEESFVLADHAPAEVVQAVTGVTDDSGDGLTTTYAVTFTRTGTTFHCRADQHVLDAAWAHGLTPASSCGQGLCGTCKVNLLDGTVDLRHAGGIRPREIANGKTLICCATPTSDLVIEA